MLVLALTCGARAALNIRNNKNVVYFVIAVEYEINFTSKISRTTVYCCLLCKIHIAYYFFL